MKPRFELGLRVDWCLTMKNGSTEPVRNFFVGVNEGRITAARPFKPADRKACRKFIDRKNMVLIPGLINAHTHLPMTLFRGLEDDVPLKVWLFDCILPLEAALTSKAFVKAGTELALRECIRFGTTTVSDMYFFTAASADVWDKGGLRGIFTQAFADFPIPEDKVYGPDREKRFFDLRKKYRAHPRIDIGVAPHAPYSCSDETLRRMGELSRQENCLLHIHVSEAAHEKPDSLEKYGEKPVHRLKRLGVLGERTVGAHSVHLDDDEIELYRETGTSPIYNPDSNSKLASGVAPLPKYLDAKIPVALGTDGSASANDLSMFGAMDVGLKIQKLFHGDAMALRGPDALRMATIDGARALGLEDRIGSIEEGKCADLVCVDLNFPHLQPVHDLVSQLVYAANGLEVDTVVCHGQVLLKDKQFAKPAHRKIPPAVESFRKKIQKHLQTLKAES
ncbi:MAG: amidohydrolase [Bdellovibrionaceae bacterium]|nr:amidohydrolase [Pseudobdellovibrionaceae bacterium]